jgi:glyoxylase-like metal-dependent hydrolase (beta-lactamase superfamily II)
LAATAPVPGRYALAGSGRTDSPAEAAEHSTSIARQLVVLPAETIVHPGHGPDTTIGRERKVNLFFPRA